VFGIAVGTAALILVLSVFNGFEDLISGLFQKFNPDIKVTPIQGKTFPLDSVVVLKLKKVEGVNDVSATLEELALFDYQNSQTFGVLKVLTKIIRRLHPLLTIWWKENIFWMQKIRRLLFLVPVWHSDWQLILRIN
jgi:ABC-type lipoprotein release transport system permease subunit